MTSFRRIQLDIQHGWLSNALLEMLRAHPRQFARVLRARHDPVLHRRSIEKFKLPERHYHRPEVARVRNRQLPFQKIVAALTALMLPTTLLIFLPRTMPPPLLRLALAQQ